MSLLERVYRIERLLKLRGSASMREIQEELEVSRATVKRDLEYLRDRLNAPVIWDRSSRTYRLEGDHALPSLYLTHAELQSLIVFYQLIARVQPSIAREEFASLRVLLPRISGTDLTKAEEVARRIRILPLGTRLVSVEIFEAVTQAVLGRKRLDIQYRSRTSGEETQRVVSPARLVYYRDNWYLDAWCHMRMGLRSFALDAIRVAHMLDESAHEVPDADLDLQLGSGYGIFGGSLTRMAVLRFPPQAARWVAGEKWHADQSGHLEADGSYTLRVPYSHDAELIRDLLRFGPDVEVLEPQELRDAVRTRLEEALRKY